MGTLTLAPADMPERWAALKDENARLAGDIDRLEELVLRFLGAWNMGEEPDEGAITDARKILWKRGAPPEDVPR